MNIERIEGIYTANVFIADEGGEVLIIDAGAPVADMKAAVGDRKVLAVLITHDHFDHLAYAADYAREFNAKIYCARETFDHLKYYKSPVVVGGKEYYIAQLDDVGETSGNAQIAVIKEETDLTFGDFTVKPIFAPGHSGGSLCFLIGDHLFAGDTLFARGIGTTDYMTDGKKRMAETLTRLADVQFGTACHGHGGDSSYEAQQRNIATYKKWLERAPK
jgi:glyoxylase-like metal-dependent hydrolase (beta-lactamase superfamily II)